MPSHIPNPDRSPTVQVNTKNLIDDGQCYQTVRELRWPDGIKCPSCASTQVIKRGFDDTELARQRYECTVGCPNRPLALDRFLDSKCQSRLFHAWWCSIFNEKG